jgi:hypothetical protein
MGHSGHGQARSALRLLAIIARIAYIAAEVALGRRPELTPPRDLTIIAPGGRRWAQHQGSLEP